MDMAHTKFFFSVWLVAALLLCVRVHTSAVLSMSHVSKQFGNVDHASHETVDRYEQWIHFKLKYKKVYSSESEEEMRKLIFFRNLAETELHNFHASRGQQTFTLAINKYSDLDHSEFTQLMNGFKGKNLTISRGMYLSPNVPISLPDVVDWRKEGYVTPVKDQGTCGSCWAFSSTGALEAQLKRKTSTLVSLSEQNLVDCSLVWGNNGCAGGLMDNSFTYIKDNAGIDTEKSYPYISKDGTCHYNTSWSGGKDSGFIDIEKGSEGQLKEAVATVGPIAVAIDASQSSFQQYQSGIYNELLCSTSNLDHAVLVVGYGTDAQTGLDYWLVKNSWGVSWGMEGYIMMSRNNYNQCGIASLASYPLV